MKNCDPLVLEPLFAIDSNILRSCLSSKFSSETQQTSKKWTWYMATVIPMTKEKEGKRGRKGKKQKDSKVCTVLIAS